MLAIVALVSWNMFKDIDYSFLLTFILFMVVSVLFSIHWSKTDNNINIQNKQSSYRTNLSSKITKDIQSQKKQLNYNIINNNTPFDNHLKIIKDTFNLDIDSFKVSGLTSIPRRLNGKEWLRVSSNGFEKLVKINFLLDTKIYGLEEFYQKATQDYFNNPQEAYKKLVIKPCSKYLNKIYGEKLKSMNTYYHLTAKPSFKNTSVWISLWIPYNIQYYLSQNSNGLTNFAKEHIPEISLLIEKDLIDLDTMKSFCANKVFRNKTLKRYENKLRIKRGVPKIGQGNLSQYTLFSLLKNYYPNVKYEYSPKWLNKMRFDIYIPSLKIAVEYHGLQHYEPVEIFGGEKSLKETKRRDKEKINLSKENGVIVYEWPYHRKVTNTEVQKFINEMNIRK